MSNKPEKIQIKSAFIRLDAALKFAGAVETGGEAKMLIQDGVVLVNGETCTQRTKKLRNGDTVTLEYKSFLIEGTENES